jgi:GH24 family phage-related lysozyme (muramidase)
LTKDQIEGFSDQRAALDAVAKEYKSQTELVEFYTKALESATGARKEQTENSLADAKAMQTMYGQILTDFNAWSLVNDKKSEKKKKSNVAFLKEELKNVQEIYKRYQEFLKYMSKEDAAAKIREIYGNVTAIDFLDPESYKTRLKSLLEAIRGQLGTLRPYNKKLTEELFNDIKQTIKKNEGLVLDAYKLPGEKYYTIGYGFYKNLPDGREITEGMRITEEEAEEILNQYVKSYSDTANKLLSEYGKGMQLTDRQFNVLVDLAYQGPAALRNALIEADGDIERLGEALKTAATNLVAPELREAVNIRDMKRYLVFMSSMADAAGQTAEEIIAATSDTERIVNDVDWDELKKQLDAELKRLTDEMKRSETARNFYNESLVLRVIRISPRA